MLLVTACQGASPLATLPGGYLSQRDDVCFTERKALADSGTTFSEDLLRNVLIGGGVGAIVGLATDKNPFATAAIGAAAAAAGTYLLKMQKEYSDGGALVTATTADIRAENEQIDRLLARFEALKACRRKEAEAVKTALRSGQIDRPTAEAQMLAIRKRYREDVARAQAIASNISKRSKSYVTAYNQIAANNDAPQLIVADYRPGAQTPPPETPKPETTPEGATERAMTVRKNANVRLGPGTKFQRVATLRAGTRVTVVGEEGEWYRLVNPQGGEPVYVAKFLLGAVETTVAKPSPEALPPASVTIAEKPGEPPLKDASLKPIIVKEADRGKLVELRNASLANVEKRDLSLERVAEAKAEEDEIFGLS